MHEYLIYNALEVNVCGMILNFELLDKLLQEKVSHSDFSFSALNEDNV
jgi:hypothetical protein